MKYGFRFTDSNELYCGEVWCADACHHDGYKLLQASAKEYKNKDMKLLNI